MTSVPAYPAALRRGGDAGSDTVGERRGYGTPYDFLNFEMMSRGGRELAVSLEVQPVFDLETSAPVSRRVRRRVRHKGGEPALAAFGRRTLEPADLKRLDVQTLQLSLELLRLGPDETGVAPLFWRTAASSQGRLMLMASERLKSAPAGGLLIEVMGGLEQAPLATIRSVAGLFQEDGLGVILHVAPDLGSVRRLDGAGARCLSLDFAGVAHETSHEWLSACELIGAARAACPQVMLANLRPDRGLAAQAAGATHAVFAGMAPITV